MKQVCLFLVAAGLSAAVLAPLNAQVPAQARRSLIERQHDRTARPPVIDERYIIDYKDRSYTEEDLQGRPLGIGINAVSEPRRLFLRLGSSLYAPKLTMRIQNARGSARLRVALDRIRRMLGDARVEVIKPQEQP